MPRSTAKCVASGADDAGSADEENSHKYVVASFGRPCRTGFTSFQKQEPRRAVRPGAARQQTVCPSPAQGGRYERPGTGKKKSHPRPELGYELNDGRQLGFQPLPVQNGNLAAIHLNQALRL